MTKPTAIAPAAIQPVATLREEDGYVLGIFEAGTLGLKFVSYVVRRRGERIRDHFGDGVEGETGQQMVGWMPIPYSDEAVHEAIAAGESLSASNTSVLEGDLKDHLQAARQIVFELVDAIGPRRAIIKLHARLGDDVDGPRLPSSAPNPLTYARAVLTDWAKGAADDDAIDRLRIALDHTAL